MLTREQAKAFYDRFGAKQDWLGFHENPAIEDLIAHAAFETARVVLEFGCGTGRLAERILEKHLPPDARYRGLDISSTMVRLANGRLARFGERAEVIQTNGSPRIDAADDSVDRVISTYVLDLLAVEDIRSLVAEAHRVLVEDGRLCLVSLTHGTTAIPRLLIRVWARIAELRPALVGGCRPIELFEFLVESKWHIHHANVVAPFAIPSQIVIASPR